MGDRDWLSQMDSDLAARGAGRRRPRCRPLGQPRAQSTAPNPRSNPDEPTPGLGPTQALLGVPPSERLQASAG
jgi:hypothetical protein